MLKIMSAALSKTDTRTKATGGRYANETTVDQPMYGVLRIRPISMGGIFRRTAVRQGEIVTTFFVPTCVSSRIGQGSLARMETRVPNDDFLFHHFGVLGQRQHSPVFSFQLLPWLPQDRELGCREARDRTRSLRGSGRIRPDVG